MLSVKMLLLASSSPMLLEIVSTNSKRRNIFIRVFFVSLAGVVVAVDVHQQDLLLPLCTYFQDEDPSLIFRGVYNKHFAFAR